MGSGQFTPCKTRQNHGTGSGGSRGPPILGQAQQPGPEACQWSLNVFLAHCSWRPYRQTMHFAVCPCPLPSPAPSHRLLGWRFSLLFSNFPLNGSLSSMTPTSFGSCVCSPLYAHLSSPTHLSCTPPSSLLHFLLFLTVSINTLH